LRSSALLCILLLLVQKEDAHPIFLRLSPANAHSLMQRRGGRGRGREEMCVRCVRECGVGARAFLRAYSGFSPTPKSGQLAQPLPGQLLHLPPPREHHPPRIRSAVCSQELCRLFAGALPAVRRSRRPARCRGRARGGRGAGPHGPALHDRGFRGPSALSAEIAPIVRRLRARAGR
jgi:hypothetical protein